MADDKNNNDVDQAAIDAILIEVDYPATPDDLAEAARDANADETVVVLFESLPDEEYASRQDVNNAVNSRKSS